MIITMAMMRVRIVPMRIKAGGNFLESFLKSFARSAAVAYRFEGSSSNAFEQMGRMEGGRVSIRNRFPERISLRSNVGSSVE